MPAKAPLPQPMTGKPMYAPRKSGGAERRHRQRWYLIFYLRVFDQDTGQLLGHVVDISTLGLMLISDKPLTAGQRYRLGLDLPKDDGPNERIIIEAHSLWCRRDVNPSFYDTGFTITQASAEALLKIQLTIDDFKFGE